MIEPGSPAPDFTLADHDGNDRSLADYAGRPLVLVFYPGDFSPVCTNQLSVYQEVVPDLESRGATLVGVSVDSRWCHAAFREHLGLSIPLLADFHPKGEMAASYGAFVEKRGTTNRSLVLIGGDGVVGWSHKASAGEVPGANLIFDALAAAR